MSKLRKYNDAQAKKKQKAPVEQKHAPVPQDTTGQLANTALLRDRFDKILRLKADQSAIGEEISQIKKELKGYGFNMKAIGAALALATLDREDREDLLLSMHDYGVQLSLFENNLFGKQAATNDLQNARDNLKAIKSASDTIDDLASKNDTTITMTDGDGNEIGRWGDDGGADLADGDEKPQDDDASKDSDAVPPPNEKGAGK